MKLNSLIRSQIVLSTILFGSVGVSLAQEETTTPTPTSGTGAPQVDAPFPQDLAIGLVVIALLVVGIFFIAYRRRYRS